MAILTMTTISQCNRLISQSINRIISILLAIAVISTARATTEEMPMSDKDHGASVTWRVLPMTWMRDESFDQLVELFTTNRITGKIALFTCTHHVPPPFEEMERECAILKRRIPALKALGYGK